MPARREVAAASESQRAVAPTRVCEGAVARSSAASRWVPLAGNRECCARRTEGGSPGDPGSATSARSRTQRRYRGIAEALPGRCRGVDDRRVVASLRPDVTRRGRESLPGLPRRRPAQVFYGLRDRWDVGMSKPSASTVPPPPRKTCGEKESNLHVPASSRITYPRNAVTRTRPMTTLPGRPDARAPTPVWPERMTPNEAEVITASHIGRQWQCASDFVSGCIEC